MYRARIARLISTELWRGVLSELRGVSALIEILASPIWILGLVLAISIQNPASLKDPISLKNLCWGIVVFIMISDKLWLVGHHLEREKRLGILEQILATNTPIALHAISASLTAMIWTMASASISIALVFPILGVDPRPANPALLVVGYILSDMMASGIALLYSNAVLVMRRPWIATNLFQFTLPVVSGLLPYNLSPEAIKRIIEVNPLSYPVEILRRGATGHQSLPADLYMALAMSIASILALYSLGIALIAILRKSMLKKGL